MNDGMTHPSKAFDCMDWGSSFVGIDGQESSVLGRLGWYAVRGQGPIHNTVISIT